MFWSSSPPSPLSPPHHHAHANKRIAQESHHSYLSISQVKNSFLLDKIIGIQLEKKKKQPYEITLMLPFFYWSSKLQFGECDIVTVQIWGTNWKSRCANHLIGGTPDPFVPAPFMGPLQCVRSLAFFLFRTQNIMRIGFYMACLVHLVEGGYAWILARKVDPSNATGWWLQTSVVGFLSLRLRLQKARHQRNEKQKWAPVAAATAMLCQKSIFHLSSGHWDLNQADNGRSQSGMLEHAEHAGTFPKTDDEFVSWPEWPEAGGAVNSFGEGQNWFMIGIYIQVHVACYEAMLK
jgi:hypothetical protein